MGREQVRSTGAAEPGLLFYLSGETGFRADFAFGDPEPNFLEQVEIIDGGVNGKAFRCADRQLMAYWAPGNIYAQRGTLSFFWRSRYPVGPTEFPIFRVGYADHSSWDAVWLRIDYNGNGFDAFVTDASLARTRVSCKVDPFPGPEQWIHLALAWDETQGIRFYVNGKPAAEKTGQAVYFAGLDQFGPHSRIIAPWNVQSDYNFIRGGDIDEIRIYDRMLSDANIGALARCEPPGKIPPLARDLNVREWRDEWLLRNGWEAENPPYLAEARTAVRKVEIHDVYDHKRWWWKCCDGIRETTWPGVYNRSRLPGRWDYFLLPDWDCYSVSGKTVNFTMPDEEWNHLEISGAAWGRVILEDGTERLLFERPQGRERTAHRLLQTQRGNKIRFENAVQETPIGELSAYYVRDGGLEPEGALVAAYELAGGVRDDDPAVAELVRFIHGRYTTDERALIGAVPAGVAVRPGQGISSAPGSLPFVHVIVPYQADDRFGLDGIAIDLPGLDLAPTHGEYFPMNIQVKDPLWYYRNLFDFSFTVKPGEARTLWLDLRDRILPPYKCLYLTIAGAGPGFGPEQLNGAKLRLIFKAAAEAALEHELDRFTQLRDNYAHLVEEQPDSDKFNLYKRFAADTRDLLRVNPGHYLTQCYWYDKTRQNKPHFEPPVVPEGIPAWAFLQAEYLKYTKRLLNWWIDERQIENGEFGGGLSDDGDLTAWWPGPALAGCMPEKIKASLLLEMEAFYDQGMFTNGLNTIQTDYLHTFEEGLQTLGQCLVLDFANPKHLERAMETARAIWGITDFNCAGHRHFISSYYSGTRIAREEPWQVSSSQSYFLLHAVYMLARYNGNPAVRQLILELADGLLAHFRDGVMYAAVHFPTDRDGLAKADREWPLFLAAYRLSGDEKYLAPLKEDQKGFFRSPGPVDKEEVAAAYGALIEAAALREYINTDGQLWVDRVVFDLTQMQRDRLGGVAHVRFACYPRHYLSWRFPAPASDESLAILVPDAGPTRLRIIVYNLEETPVRAELTTWDIEPGRWEISQGIDANGDDEADTGISVTQADLERSKTLELTFPPRRQTVIRLKLKGPGVPYWERPDLGISADDIRPIRGAVKVKVHSLGAVMAPPVKVALRDRTGEIVAVADTPPLPAPLDLFPVITEVLLPVAEGLDLKGYTVEIDPDGKLLEITRENNRVVIE